MRQELLEYFAIAPIAAHLLNIQASMFSSQDTESDFLPANIGIEHEVNLKFAVNGEGSLTKCYAASLLLMFLSFSRVPFQSACYGMIRRGR